MSVMRRVGAAAMALALLGGLSACGDDGGGDEESQEEDASGSGSGDEGSEDEGGDDEGASGGDLSSEDCAELLSTANAFSDVFTGDDVNFDDVAEGFDAMAEQVPDEVGDALRTIGEAYQEFAEAIGDIDLSDPDALADPEFQQRLAEASAIFEDADVVAASEELEEFGATACGGALDE